MAEKRTKSDKLQQNVERLEEREEARLESEIEEGQSEPAGTIPDPAALEEQIRFAPANSTRSAAAKTAAISTTGSRPKRRSSAARKW